LGRAPEPPDASGNVSGPAERAGAYYTGTYPDLFSDLLGKSGPDIGARMDAAFLQLFYGDNDTARVYYPVGEDMAYIEDIANGDVRTEGMSYGMMIAVQMDRKAEFDRLWRWAKTFMQLHEGPHKGYFAWHCRPDGTVLDSTAASDGEEWFVMSLFFASARWGDGRGIYEYRREANRILNTMLHKESEPGHANVTNMFNAENHLVVFVPDARGNQFTDPSYHLPHYYELYARWAADDNRFWCDAAAAARRFARKAADPVSGLSPDYAQFDGAPVHGRPGGHDGFRFDAWRVAMNTAVDWTWFEKDSGAVARSNLLLGFFRSEGIGKYGNQYALTGKKLSGDHSAGLVAANAVAALSSTRPDRRDFVEEFWNAPVPAGHYRYYDGMLYMLAMLQVSGNFRIYDPAGKAVPACPE
ncbi:MAG TPA: glycosyl hydrolase family 8, partial [Bacteroidota bacterium]|nr:glycosyl hydrolase family 8 [Bacteroidota bacterium]